MKKYWIVGIVVFSLMATTVYALNNGEIVSTNDILSCKQNCPYRDDNGVCDYYEETNTHRHQNTVNGNCQYNTENYHEHGRHCKRHHNNQ